MNIIFLLVVAIACAGSFLAPNDKEAEKAMLEVAQQGAKDAGWSWSSQAPNEYKVIWEDPQISTAAPVPAVFTITAEKLEK